MLLMVLNLLERKLELELNVLLDVEFSREEDGKVNEILNVDIGYVDGGLTIDEGLDESIDKADDIDEIPAEGTVKDDLRTESGGLKLLDRDARGEDDTTVGEDSIMSEERSVEKTTVDGESEKPGVGEFGVVLRLVRN